MDEKKYIIPKEPLDDEALDDISGGVASNAVTHVPSIRCPLCGQDISLSIQTLLTVRFVQCTACGKNFDIGRTGAKKIKEVLEKYSALR